MKQPQLFYFDTHAHMQFEAYDDDRKETIARALEDGTWMINIGIDKKSSEQAIDLAEKYNEGVYAAVGLHPNETTKEFFDMKTFRKLADHPKVVALGEVGLDYYRLPEKIEGEQRQEMIRRQHEALMGFFMLSQDLHLPLILHLRDGEDESAVDDAIELIRNYNRNSTGFDLRGVAHSFTGTEEQARKLLELGFKIGVNGIATFPKGVQNIVKMVPLEHLIIETDCPYLAPEPHRGKRNEPAYVRFVGEEVARLKNLPAEEIAFATTRTAATLFHKIEVEHALPHSRKF